MDSIYSSLDNIWKSFLILFLRDWGIKWERNNKILTVYFVVFFINTKKDFDESYFC